jgi:hypothetical protein
MSFFPPASRIKDNTYYGIELYLDLILCLDELDVQYTTSKIRMQFYLDAQSSKLQPPNQQQANLSPYGTTVYITI